MNNNNSSKNAERGYDAENYFCAFVGFIFAITNHLFGWLSEVLKMSHWNTYAQAAIASFIGAAFLSAIIHVRRGLN